MLLKALLLNSAKRTQSVLREVGRARKKLLFGIARLYSFLIGAYYARMEIQTAILLF